MYLNRGSGLPELMRIVFSVMVSALRFLIGGILTWEGSISKGGLVRKICFLQVCNDLVYSPELSESQTSPIEGIVA